MTLLEALAAFPRVAITGGPKTGKTTLADRLSELTGRQVFHTDDLANLEWSEASLAASRWFDGPEWIVEGVAVPRALRKWLGSNQDSPLDAALVYLRDPVLAITKSQEAMAKGVRTVWEEIRTELRARGAQVLIPGNYEP